MTDPPPRGSTEPEGEEWEGSTRREASSGSIRPGPAGHGASSDPSRQAADAASSTSREPEADRSKTANAGAVLGQRHRADADAPSFTGRRPDNDQPGPTDGGASSDPSRHATVTASPPSPPAADAASPTGREPEADRPKTTSANVPPDPSQQATDASNPTDHEPKAARPVDAADVVGSVLEAGSAGDGGEASSVRASRVAAVALVVAGLAYSSWMLAGWLNPPLNSVDSYASELAATDQPWSAFFRAGDVVAGVAAVVAGVFVARRRPRLGWACVTAFGAFTALDSGLFPMACAPSVDAACAAAEAAGTVPLRHQLHTGSSSLAAAAALVGLVVVAWTWRTVAAWVLCGLMVVATAGTVAAVAADGFVGLGQRFQLLVVAGWLLWLGLRLWRDGGAGRGRELRE